MRPFLATSVPIALGVLLAGCSGGLTEQSARSVVDASAQATKHSNFDQMAAYTSDDCVFQVTVPKPDGTPDTSSKPCRDFINDQRKQIGSAIANGASRDYDATVSTVVIDGDKATARLHAIDSLSEHGHTMKAESDQLETLQMRNGKLLITAIDEKATHLVIDGQRAF
jgi:hypothetical protein